MRCLATIMSPGRHHPDDKAAGWWDNMIGPGKPIDTSRFLWWA